MLNSFSESVNGLMSLSYCSRHDFFSRLEKCRAEIFSKSVSKSEEVCMESWHQFCQSEPLPSRFKIAIRDIPFHCLYKKGTDQSLVVIFNGSRPAQKEGELYRYRAPRFSYSNMLSSHFLFIDDPMYYIYPALQLGWYYGYEDVPFLLLADALVKMLARNLDIANEKITFFSSSGGGYAAFVASSYLPGTCSISINPQLTLEQYPVYEHFKDITGLDLTKEDKYSRNDIVTLLRRSRSKHIFIVNSRSGVDIDQQLGPITKKLEIKPRYGMVVKGNLLLWIYEAVGRPCAHTSFETRPLFLAIWMIAQLFKQGIVLDQLQTMAIIVNEIWSERYREMKALSSDDNTSDIIIMETKKPITSNRSEEILTDVYLRSSPHRYRHMALFKVLPYKHYYIQMELDTGYIKPFSYGLYDYTRSRFISCLTSDGSHIVNFSFISGQYPDCKFIFYSDIIGATSGKDMKLKRVTIQTCQLQNIDI